MKRTRRSKSKFHEFVLNVEKYKIDITVPVYCDKQGSHINKFFTESVCVNPPSGEPFVVERVEDTDIVLLRQTLIKILKDKTRKDLVFSFYEGPVKGSMNTLGLYNYFADRNRYLFDLEDEINYKRIYALLNFQDLRYLAIDEDGLIYEKESAISSMQQRVSIDIDNYTKISNKDLKNKVEKLVTLLPEFVQELDKVFNKLYDKVDNLDKTTNVNDPDLLASTDLMSILKKYQ